MSEILTEHETQAVQMAAELWNHLCHHVVGRDRTRDADLAELIVHIHAIQQAVMSNAASRAYPGQCRALGGTLAARDELDETTE